MGKIRETIEEAFHTRPVETTLSKSINRMVMQAKDSVKAYDENPIFSPVGRWRKEQFGWIVSVDGVIFKLNETTKDLLELCDGQHPVDELAKSLITTHKLNPIEAISTVQHFLMQASKAHILVWVAPRDEARYI